MKSIKIKFFITILFLYFFFGSYNSVNTGISFDEKHEELNWNFHVNLFKELTNVIIKKKEFDQDKFDTEIKAYVGYGIGFQIISQPIQFFLKEILKKIKI